MKTYSILSEDVLKYVSAGATEVSSETRAKNVINFYLNLVPGVHKKHYKITYDKSEWSDENGKYTRNITQTVEESDMSWKVLSKSEKLGVCLPELFAGFTALGIGACGLARWAKTKIKN